MAKNRAMASKRVHGPSPNTEMNLRMATEVCTSGKGHTPVVTFTDPENGTIKRYCLDHFQKIKDKERKRQEIARDIAWLEGRLKK